MDDGTTMEIAREHIIRQEAKEARPVPLEEPSHENR
jgi:hypothetical protein